MAGGARPDPFRTRKLSRRAPMVLRGQPVGEQGAADRWTALDPYVAGSGAGAPRGIPCGAPFPFSPYRSAEGPVGPFFHAARGCDCGPDGAIHIDSGGRRRLPRGVPPLFVASKKLTKRHVAFERYGRHVLHYIFALPSIKAASMRWLAPLNSTSLPWWTILSIMAEASLSSPRTVPHFENSMFVVNIMLRLS